MTDAKDDVAIGRLAEGNFQITMQLSQQRTIVVSGYLYANDAPGEANARIDRAQDALDRQLVRCDIVNKRAQIKAQQQGIEQYRDQLADLAKKQAARQNGGANGGPRPKLTSQEQQQLTNGQHTIDQAAKNIERLEADIVLAQKLVDSGAAAP